MSKKKEKLLVGGVVCLLALTLAMGTCYGEKLVIWGWDEVATKMLKPVIDEFEAAHPGVQVERVNFSYYDLCNKFLVAVSAGTGAPDVSFMDPYIVGRKYYPTGVFLELTDVAPNWKEIYPRMFHPSFSYDDRLFCLPWDMSASVVFYRKDIFDEIGARFPTNWQDFIKVGKKITADFNNDGVIDRYMNCFRQVDAGLQWVMSRGLQVTDTEGNILFNNPLVIETYQWLADLVLKHKITNYEYFWEPASFEMIKKGRYACVAMPIWYASFIKGGKGAPYEGPAYNPDFVGKWRVSLWLPWTKDAEPSGAWWGGCGWVVPTQTKHPKLAKELAKWISVREKSQLMIADIGKFPALIPALKKLSEREDPFFGGQKIFKILEEAVAFVPTMEVGPNYKVISTVLQKAQDDICLGGMSVEEAIKRAEKEAKLEIE